MTAQTGKARTPRAARRLDSAPETAPLERCDGSPRSAGSFLMSAWRHRPRNRPAAQRPITSGPIRSEAKAPLPQPAPPPGQRPERAAIVRARLSLLRDYPLAVPTPDSRSRSGARRRQGEGRRRGVAGRLCSLRHRRGRSPPGRPCSYPPWQAGPSRSGPVPDPSGRRAGLLGPRSRTRACRETQSRPAGKLPRCRTSLSSSRKAAASQRRRRAACHQGSTQSQTRELGRPSGEVGSGGAAAPNGAGLQVEPPSAVT